MKGDTQTWGAALKAAFLPLIDPPLSKAIRELSEEADRLTDDIKARAPDPVATLIDGLVKR